jgi:hypothetical protein
MRIITHLKVCAFSHYKGKNIPNFFLKKVKDHSQVLKTLVDKRGAAAYGYTEGYSKDNFKKDAKRFKDKVPEILRDCEKLLKLFNSNKSSNK